MQDEKAPIKKPWWQPALAVFARMSAWIAFPVIAATFAGNWLDKKYDSAPWGLISLVGISFAVSMTGLVLEAGKEYKKLSRKDPGQNEEQEQGKK